MEQRPDCIEKASAEGMTVLEVTRLNDWLRAKGISDNQILDCQRYIATGIGLPTKAPTKST